MRRRRSPILLAVAASAVVASVLVGLLIARADRVQPANPAASGTTRDLLDWLAHLPDRPDNRIVSGLFGGYSDHGFSLDQIEQTHGATGQYPAILGCDYGAGWATAPDITSHNPTYLTRKQKMGLPGRSTLRATARVAPWGDHAGGCQARLYVKTGSGWRWTDGGAVPVGPGGTTLTLDLTGVPDLGDVREIGVQFLPATGASGSSAVYVDNVTVE